MANEPARSGSGPALEAGRFDALYRQNVGVIHRYAAARLGVHEGEDVTAEVFHAAIRALRNGVDVNGAWLMAVVKNKVIDHWRRTERRAGKLHLIWTADGQREPHENLFAELDQRQVVEVLDRLSERHRLLLVLHYLDGYTAADLAEISGGTAAAVESALARARRSFRSLWTEAEARNA